MCMELISKGKMVLWLKTRERKSGCEKPVSKCKGLGFQTLLAVDQTCELWERDGIISSCCDGEWIP